MMEFIPKQSEVSYDVPFYDEVTADAGWRGHSTSKSMDTLKAEITQAVARLGGMVVGFQRGDYRTKMGNGTYIDRPGIQVHYAIEGAPDKKNRRALFPGRLDVAALPVREPKRRSGYRDTKVRRIEQTMKMALYMTRDALDGLWFLRTLSPGFAPLMPWMLSEADPNSPTISQLWSESSVMKQLAPPEGSEWKSEGDEDEESDTVDGEFREA